jgi:uncharacterized protein YodC (DUF2158 family)
MRGVTNFSVGDVVRLKSGGPVMTIRLIEKDIAQCVWFEQTKKMEGAFSIYTIERVDAPGGSGAA